jgi:hypothetical protein
MSLKLKLSVLKKKADDYDALNENGTLFLYLPDYSQEYWRPWNNKKHNGEMDLIGFVY